MALDELIDAGVLVLAQRGVVGGEECALVHPESVALRRMAIAHCFSHAARAAIEDRDDVAVTVLLRELSDLPYFLVRRDQCLTARDRRDLLASHARECALFAALLEAVRSLGDAMVPVAELDSACAQFARERRHS